MSQDKWVFPCTICSLPIGEEEPILHIHKPRKLKFGFDKQLGATPKDWPAGAIHLSCLAKAGAFGLPGRKR